LAQPWVTRFNEQATLKALASCAASFANTFGVDEFFVCIPRVVALLQPWVTRFNEQATLKALASCAASLANTFGVDEVLVCIPRVVALLQPWAAIRERLRR
jgi:hypothetical protein